MERYICVHGHFYQPPRENPWLEDVELQDSAYPYHDWNDRITGECYAPNTASRILDGEGRIVQIDNSYAKISFNFGPTLLAWLEKKAPEVYEAVLRADRESREVFSGHGSALAQAYNHPILPLANRRDKYSQIIWGIRDFEHRFGRSPEGMWLPETAVDLETLDILAEMGIGFTILAPYQARRARPIGGRAWRDVSGGRIDPTMAYALRLPSRRRIHLFFYDGPISRSVAFENLLTSGEDFAHRLLGAFSEARAWPQLVHIATDGETYGHHRPHGDMALASALHYIESNGVARITNYGEYLERHPPTHEVEIFENTSWSCGHGIERWKSDCGCSSGVHPGWNQSWRAPLRKALDWLRDTLAPRYEEHAGQLLKDPWAARNDYIDVILDRSSENVEQFLARHAVRRLRVGDKTTALKLLELQRHAMLMYTSCGWFFDDLSGIETVQVIRYAGRAIQLAQELFGDGSEPRFLELLERAKSNIPAHRDGRHIYEKFVKPAVVDLAKVAAHYAVSSLFESYPKRAKVYCYTVDRADYRRSESGETKLAVGQARITSEITHESALLSFGVVHFGGHNLNSGVRQFRGEEAYEVLVQEVTEAFARAGFAEVVRLLDRHFLELTYSLRSLFRDEQRRILNVIMASTLADTEAIFRQMYERHAPLMRFLADLGMPLPRAFHTAAELVLNAGLRQAFQGEKVDPPRVAALLDEVRVWQVDLDTAGLSYTLKQTIERLAERFREQFAELTLLQRLEAAVDMARSLPFEVDLWKAQNAYYELLRSTGPKYRAKAVQGDERAQAWVDSFIMLGDKLGVRTEE
jgi:alpha-amylase/alpha-mannosidase (GH57 family)